MKSDDNVGLGFRGGKGRRGGRELPSPLKVIIVVNIVVFVLQNLFNIWGTTAYLPGVGERFFPGGETSWDLVFRQGQVWTLVTYMFVHGSLIHILFNLILIYTCGRAVITILGEKHFLKIYLLAGLLGALLQMVLFPNPLIGASACGFGLLIAVATMIPEQQVTMLLFFVLPIRLRLKNLAYGLVGISVLFLLIGIIAGSGRDIPMVSGIGHAAHLGGALAGFLYIRLSGFGGMTLTREGLMRQRAKSERKAKARPPGKKRGKTVTTSEVKRAAKGMAKRKKGDFVSAEIDPILDKINREGFGSLTEEEREVLEAGSQKISDSANSK